MKKEIKRLINNNRELEETVRTLLAEKDAKPKFDFEKENLIRDNKTLKK